MIFNIVFLNPIPIDKAIIRNSPDCAIQVSLISAFSAFAHFFFLVKYLLGY